MKNIHAYESPRMMIASLDAADIVTLSITLNDADVPYRITPTKWKGADASGND